LARLHHNPLHFITRLLLLLLLLLLLVVTWLILVRVLPAITTRCAVENFLRLEVQVQQ